MAADQQLVKRIQDQLQYFAEAFEAKKMFGGVAYLYQNKMTVGVVKNELAVRIVADKMAYELEKSFVRPMDFTGKPLKEFVFVAQEGITTEEALLHYIHLGLEHAKFKLGEL